MTAPETTPPEGSPEAWLDEGEISRAWPPPAGNPVGRAPVSGSLVYGGVVLGVVLLIAAVWSTGGFGRRTDLLRPVEPGAQISTGPFEFSFTEATAQQQSDPVDGTTKWEIVIIGRARNTSDTSLTPPTLGGDSMFAIKDPGSVLTAEPSNQEMGDAPDKLGIYSRLTLAPGLSPIGYRLVFPLPAEFRPGTTIRLGVSDLVYRTKYLTSSEKAWDSDLYGTRTDLPLRVLPPKS